MAITRDGESVVTHENWRGQFSPGTYPSGYRSDCTSYPASGCTPIAWPGERTTMRHELEEDGRIQNRFGGLVDGTRDVFDAKAGGGARTCSPALFAAPRDASYQSNTVSRLE